MSSFCLYVDIHFGTGVVCMVMSTPVVLSGAFWHVCICFFVFRCVYLCRVVYMPVLFSFLFLPVGTPIWIVRVVEMSQRECLQRRRASERENHKGRDRGLSERTKEGEIERVSCAQRERWKGFLGGGKEGGGGFYVGVGKRREEAGRILPFVLLK